MIRIKTVLDKVFEFNMSSAGKEKALVEQFNSGKISLNAKLDMKQMGKISACTINTMEYIKGFSTPPEAVTNV